PPKSFDIIEGSKMWEQEVGVPQTGGGAPEVRKFMLQQANYIKGQLRLYLRVTDAYGRAIRVVPIGPLVSFGRPEPPQVDNLSNLHVLYQNGPFSFSYTVFNPDGELITRQVHDFSTSRPHLFATGDGAIVIKGGSRRITPNDVPPPKDDDEDTSSSTTVSKSETKTPTPETPAKSK